MHAESALRLKDASAVTLDGAIARVLAVDVVAVADAIPDNMHTEVTRALRMGARDSGTGPERKVIQMSAQVRHLLEVYEARLPE